MLLVVFGAGASFDSAPDYSPSSDHRNAFESRPPLANQLFENRPIFRAALKNFRQCLPLVTRLSNPEPSIETQLDALLIEGDRYPARHQQLAAIRFYLRRIIHETALEWRAVHGEVTNYKTLLDDLERWRLQTKEEILFVTFNYDTMLEEALPIVGRSCKKLEDYINQTSYKVIKVHGSVNWTRQLKEPTRDPHQKFSHADMIQYMIEHAETLEVSDRFLMMVNPGVAFESIYPGSLIGMFPAIAIPVTQKVSFECPQTHLDTLIEVIPKVTKILTVGWRGTEQHFLKLLGQHVILPLNRVIIVAGDLAEAHKVEINLKQTGLGGIYFKAGGGFTDALKRREIDSFLWREL